MNTSNPKRCIVTVRGNTAPGNVSLSGTDIAGRNIGESTPNIPALAEYQEYTYVSRHAYATVQMSRTGLANAQIALGRFEDQKFTVEPPARSSLTEQDKGAIRAMIHEEISALKKSLVDEVIMALHERQRL
jgi:hypothetical protein